jgi:hypothetical protein
MPVMVLVIYEPSPDVLTCFVPSYGESVVTTLKFVPEPQLSCPLKSAVFSELNVCSYVHKFAIIF